MIDETKLRALIVDAVREALSAPRTALVSPAEAASTLRVKPDTVRRWARAGRLECKRVGRRLLVGTVLREDPTRVPTPEEFARKLMSKYG